MYYRAKGKAVCADVIPYYEDGKYYLFYLKDFRDFQNHGEGCPWCLLTTTDFVNYKEYGEVIKRGTVEEQDLYVFTGSCSKFNDEYYIFYTGHNPHLRKKGLPEQKVLLAKSNDLINWKKVKDFVFEAPDWLEMHDFRDPYVYFDENKNKYAMLLAARLKNEQPINSKGITIVAYSDDLLNWKVSDNIFYAPNAYFTHECPDLFKMGEWWYLVFSEFTDKIVTKYRMSKNIDGPWITPLNDTFDAHAFYAAKTVSNGNRRFVIGWNCIRNNEIDFDFWQWGGTIIVHEIIQMNDGSLSVKCPKEIQNQYQRKLDLTDCFEVGKVSFKNDKVIIGKNDNKSFKLFGKMQENMKIELDFEIFDKIGDFGVILRSDDKVNQYYALKFEPKFNRFAVDRWPRRDSTLHINVDTERYCPLKIKQKNKLIIIVEGTVAEVYVNDMVALSFRMFDFKEGHFGLYTHNTKIKFSNIKIKGR